MRVPDDTLRVTYVGHATVLLQTQGLNILTDPIWSERASPLSFAGPKRVAAPGVRFEDLPPIDVVLLSHNHYDHLDLPTLDRLFKAFNPLLLTPLGNDAIMLGAIPGMRVKALDWGESFELNRQVRFTLEPMQHWSARSLFDRREAMWHHGDTTGFRTTIQRFPDDALTVVVLANRDDLDAQALALEVAKPYLGVRGEQ